MKLNSKRIKFSLAMLFVASSTFVTDALYAAAGSSSKSELSLEELSKIAKSTDGRKFYTGDIIIYYRGITPKAAIGGTRWARGEFIYQFSGQTEEQQDIFRAACNAWTINTPVRCIERTNQPNFALIVTHNGEGCGGDAVNVSCSAIGMVTGQQEIEVYSSHWSASGQSVIEHEIGHALGLIHEQSRSDRDSYVTINYSNIKASATHNFNIDSESQNFSDYDYNSTMHYSNCTFSTQPALCRSNDLTTERYWTISPIPCAISQVGGRTITQLDLDGIRRAYGGSAYALYDQHRSSTCGVLNYSKAQVVNACGAGCQAAGAVIWSRSHIHYDWGCGWITILDGKKYCDGRKQEFKEQWYDKDPFHSKCWGGTLVERWTECGCTIQQLRAQCANFSSGVNLSKLQALIDSNEPFEREIGRFVKTMIEYDSKGFFSSALVKDLPLAFIDVFARGDISVISNILCDVKIELTLQRLINKDYEMSRARFVIIAMRYGIIL
jgi:hypothetical protein